MVKKFIMLTILTISIYMLNAEPNTLVNCNTDQDCQTYATNHPNASCKKKPDFNTPAAKCQSRVFGGRTVKYCVCEYASSKPNQKNNTEGMYDLFTGCSTSQPCSGLGVSCSSGALPQCDAVQNGICYCPF